MSHRAQAKARPAPPSTESLPVEIVADPVQSSAQLSRELPVLIEQAEAAGLSIIAQHLRRALTLADRVAASSRPPHP